MVPKFPVSITVDSIRMMLAVAAELGYKIYMMGVQTALFDAGVEEEGFV